MQQLDKMALLTIHDVVDLVLEVGEGGRAGEKGRESMISRWPAEVVLLCVESLTVNCGDVWTSSNDARDEERRGAELTRKEPPRKLAVEQVQGLFLRQRLHFLDEGSLLRCRVVVVFVAARPVGTTVVIPSEGGDKKTMTREDVADEDEEGSCGALAEVEMLLNGDRLV